MKSGAKRSRFAVGCVAFALASLTQGGWARELSNEIVVQHDRFDGVTKVFYTPPPGDAEDEVGFSLVGLAPEGVRRFDRDISISLNRASADLRYGTCNRVNWLADGVPVSIGDAEYRFERIGGGVLEWLTIYLRIGALAPLASANKIEFRICNDEFVLHGRHRVALQEFYARMTRVKP